MSAWSAIFIKLYPNEVGKITSWSETALGMGYSIGPALGGVLYDVRGFHLPFIIIGVFGILFAIVTLLALPQEESNLDGQEKLENLSMARIILEV